MVDMAAAQPDSMCMDNFYAFNYQQNQQLNHQHQQDLSSTIFHRDQDMSRNPDLYPTPPQELHIDPQQTLSPYPQGPVAPQRPVAPQGPLASQIPVALQGPVAPQDPVAQQGRVALQGPVASQVQVAPQGPLVPQSPVAPQVPEVPQVPRPKVAYPPCFGCGSLIKDLYVYDVGGCPWHSGCLRCCICQRDLHNLETCLVKEGNIYCKEDYITKFATKCSTCADCIGDQNWVLKMKDTAFYHLNCFACHSCNRPLRRERSALHEDRLLCETHYLESCNGGSSNDTKNSQKTKTKRVRTTFTDEEQQVLLSHFQKDSNPDGQELERIAQIIGRSKRVVQVWFQNTRARLKKDQQQDIKHECNGTMLNHSGSNNDTTISPLNTNTT